MPARRLQIAIVGSSEEASLVEAAATVVARRGANLLVLDSPFGEAVVLAASKIASMRYLALGYPKSGGSLDLRARLPTEISAIEALCSSADGLIMLGDSPVAEAIARRLGKPVSKPSKPDECLLSVGDLLNRILSEQIRQ